LPPCRVPLPSTGLFGCPWAVPAAAGGGSCDGSACYGLCCPYRPDVTGRQRGEPGAMQAPERHNARAAGDHDPGRGRYMQGSAVLLVVIGSEATTPNPTTPPTIAPVFEDALRWWLYRGTGCLVPSIVVVPRCGDHLALTGAPYAPNHSQFPATSRDASEVVNAPPMLPLNPGCAGGGVVVSVCCKDR